MNDKKKSDLLEALNRLDELADYGIDEGNMETCDQADKDYSLLANYIQHGN